MNLDSMVILGATGPTGRHLAKLASAEGISVRVVSRSHRNLDHCFPEDHFERRPADLENREETVKAVDGVDLVFDCVGLPAELMDRHPVIAGNIAAAIRETKTSAIQVSSFWAYLPVRRLPLDETHPRQGGSAWVRLRREAESILEEAGASILHLPDFYGPLVHTSVLQNVLVEAAQGKRTLSWIGGAEVSREHIHVRDAMKLALRLARCGRNGERWMLPGAGGMTALRVADIIRKHLGTPVRIRSAGPFLLRLVSLFKRDLRGFMQMVPHYTQPVSFTAQKLERAIGEISLTPYERGIPETLDWLKNR